MINSNIIVNARCLEYKMSGIERYVIELVNGLQQLGLPSNRIKLISQSKIIDKFAIDNLDNVFPSNSSILPGFLSKFKWEMIDAGQLAKKIPGDIYHGPNFVLPNVGIKDKKSIITIHDFAFLKFPECFDFRTRAYYKLVLARSIHQADRIICISQSTLSDLKCYFPKYAHKAVVVHNGFTDLRDLNSEEIYVDNLGLDVGEYYLSVGTINKRKNLTRVVQAYNELRLSGKTTKKLVLVGDSRVHNRDILNNPDIIFTGFISDIELATLYGSCFCFLFPSLYEGFGMPVLEAMAFGKPVIISNTSSLPEISGYADEWMVDPFSSTEIHKSMLRLEQSSQLYNEMASVGLEQVKNFSWLKMASETNDVYMS